jgi:hypothetical protein
MSALPLLVLRVSLADDPRHAIAFDNLAVLADRLNARTNLHSLLLCERTPELAKTLKIETLAGACK